MRISDWSSDVCSSDLPSRISFHPDYTRCTDESAGFRYTCGTMSPWPLTLSAISKAVSQGWKRCFAKFASSAITIACCSPAIWLRAGRIRRSEEHTSELQSLMRISYAVFCLKKKKYEIQQ